jgi:hypothetical protein
MDPSPSTSPCPPQALRDCLHLLAKHHSQSSPSKLLDQLELRLLWLLRTLCPSDYLISDQLRAQHLQMLLVQRPDQGRRFNLS